MTMKPMLAAAFLTALCTLQTGCTRSVSEADAKPAPPDLPGLVSRPWEKTPSDEFRKVEAAVHDLHARIGREPANPAGYIELARLLLVEGRTSGVEHHYIPSASRMIDSALARDSSSFESTLLKGTVLMSLHQFPAARAYAERTVALNPSVAAAYGVLCDANIEMGDYPAAVRACDRMISLRPDIRSYSRVSYLRELHGDWEGAVEAMKMAVESGAPGNVERAWAACTLGNLYMAAGHADSAELVFRKILEERPMYGFALSGLAVVEASRDNYGRAVELLEQAVDISDQHLFFEQLAFLYKKVGNEAGVEKMMKQVAFEFHEHDSLGWDVDREYAQFAADHDIDLPGALDRARRDYERRPENIDALQTYAWLLHGNGKSDEAMRYIDRAMRLDSGSAMLNYYAGMISAGAGDGKRAVRHLERALRRNPFLTMVARDTAVATLRSLRPVAGRIPSK